MKLLSYQPTVVQEIHHKILQDFNLTLLVKREDRNHPQVSGNKWWKLKYNINEALKQKKTTLLTFGGAYSNHIFATAAAAHELKLNSIGIIRGEETLPLNSTLSFAKAHGMKLHYISREQYRTKDDPQLIESIYKHVEDFYVIPEGGTNLLAVQGCAEFAETQLQEIKFDYLYLPLGTGGTMAGMICGLPENKKVVGISVLKNGEFLNAEVEKLATQFSKKKYSNWKILTSYDHGGYAKTTDTLLKFITEMEFNHHLPLDPVYTGKLMWAIFKEIETGRLPAGSTILALHTGGLQGNIKPA